MQQFDPLAPQAFDPNLPRTQPPFDPRKQRHQVVEPRDPRLVDPRKQQGRQPSPVDQQARPGPPTQKIPLDQYGRLFRPEDLARIPHDSFGRPLDLDQRLPPDQFGRMIQTPEELRKQKQFSPVPVDQFGRPLQPQKPKPEQTRPPPDYNAQEKKKLVPQAKGETPSKKEMKRTREQDLEDPGLPHVGLKEI
ncbi:unnamed protein product [Nippostrongylus brasiliensis]|uniref:Uncharacterized protein n=1 Tax=Nippostrongylus brasiliensis TaxID=27835 RepID=A0A3P6ZZU4_NIPBR|nr:unnamed protein product [Nippostrongylus brasiliensis]